MKIKNVETNEVYEEGKIQRSQLGLPHLYLTTPPLVIEFEGKHILGLWELFENYMGEKNNDIQQHIRTLKDKENQGKVDTLNRFYYSVKKELEKYHKIKNPTYLQRQNMEYREGLVTDLEAITAIGEGKAHAERKFIVPNLDEVRREDIPKSSYYGESIIPITDKDVENQSQVWIKLMAKAPLRTLNDMENQININKVRDVLVDHEFDNITSAQAMTELQEIIVKDSGNYKSKSGDTIKNICEHYYRRTMSLEDFGKIAVGNPVKMKCRCGLTIHTEKKGIKDAINLGLPHGSPNPINTICEYCKKQFPDYDDYMEHKCHGKDL